MSYYYVAESGVPDIAIEANAGMKWFRSNIGLGSRLALVALAIQFLLSFGHFHGSAAVAGAAQAELKISNHERSNHEPDGEQYDFCAICAVMALGNAMVDATPPSLPALQAAAFAYLAPRSDALHLSFSEVAYQPRAPPVS